MSEANAEPQKPIVAVCMGSTSDLPTMRPAVELLRQHGVATEVRILSAHRIPTQMLEFGRTAEERGYELIIAGAGGAAHLPGMLASVTALPVIGVPVPLKHLDGMDSLLSIVQMPRGTPVATVGVGNATNAGHLALRILGGSRPELRKAVRDYQAKTAAKVTGDDETTRAQE